MILSRVEITDSQIFTSQLSFISFLIKIVTSGHEFLLLVLLRYYSGLLYESNSETVLGFN